MAKWAAYLISHVQKDSKGRITHVLLHTDNGDTVEAGVIKSESEVIQKLKNGYTVKTILWGYPSWNMGAEVSYVSNSSGEFLRTNRDKTEKDNLDNLLLLIN